ncbi:MAG: hypothetical protein ACR2JV_07955 [Gaiellales bacterium]
MHADALTPLQRQIYWSAPSPLIDGCRRRTAFGLNLVLGCERLLREGRLRGSQARLAMAQAQAARLLVAEATGARWLTRRGDVLRKGGDELAAALVTRARGTDDHLAPAASMIAACDLLDEICDWLADGQLLGAAAPAAIDRLRVAQVLVRQHVFEGDERDDLPPPTRMDIAVAEQASETTPNAWLDDE